MASSLLDPFKGLLFEDERIFKEVNRPQSCYFNFVLLKQSVDGKKVTRDTLDENRHQPKSWIWIRPFGWPNFLVGVPRLGQPQEQRISSYHEFKGHYDHQTPSLFVEFPSYLSSFLQKVNLKAHKFLQWAFHRKTKKKEFYANNSNSNSNANTNPNQKKALLKLRKKDFQNYQNETKVNQIKDLLKYKKKMQDNKIFQEWFEEHSSLTEIFHVPTPPKIFFFSKHLSFLKWACSLDNSLSIWLS